MRGIVIARVFIAVTLAVIGVAVIFRRYLPTLPFKVGDTVQVGGRLGKVEATTVLNTRLRTFDGKTVFMPNRKILNEDVINYHFTPERQIRTNPALLWDPLRRRPHQGESSDRRHSRRRTKNPRQTCDQSICGESEREQR
jgi:hypothetical protein